MKLEDTYEDQPVALIESFEGMPKGSLGILKGFSQVRQCVLIEWEPGSRQQSAFVPLSKLLGVCQ